MTVLRFSLVASSIAREVMRLNLGVPPGHLGPVLGTLNDALGFLIDVYRLVRNDLLARYV